MTVKQQLEEALSGLNEEQQRLLLALARALDSRQEAADWTRFGADQFARAYGDDEPEYTEADIKLDPTS